MAYDAESDRMILYGGTTGDLDVNPNNVSGETWAYDATRNKWTQMKPPSGPAKGGPALTYDAESDRVILFGTGINWRTGGSAVTWAYDFNTNTWQSKAIGPSRLLGTRITYDAESDRVILFGGYDVPGNKLRNPTWSYDYNSNTWTEMKPSVSPQKRNYHAMDYDIESDRVIVWGGGDFEPMDPSVWAYDYNTNTWEKMPINGGPSPHDYDQMIYNAKADRMIVYNASETWAYDYNANQWTNMAPSSNPAARLQYAMAYAAGVDQVILFGGSKGIRFDYTDETWAYDFTYNEWMK